MPFSRREFVVMSSAALGAVPLRSLRNGQPPAQPPTGRFETIRRNVGYFAARGGTIGWLVNDGAVVVIDTQYADTAKICVDGLKQRSSRGIDLLINTHHHGDHTGGNAVFRPETRKIVAHARVPELQKMVASQTANAPAPVVADATFTSVWSERMGDETVSAKHHGPGHTGGDAVIRFERANVVHMGDLLFHERHPRVDRPGGANIQNWIKTIEAVAKEMPADTIYIAGHTKTDLPVTVGRKDLLRQKDYFDAVLTYVRKGIAAGQSKDEIVALKALPGFEGHMESPPVLTLAGVLTAAHEELTIK